MPNLKSLKLSLSPNKMALAGLLSTNHALKHLHIHIDKKFMEVQSASSEILRHELQDQLPLRLSKITLQGDQLSNIHPAAFKYLRSQRLELRVMATNEVQLDRDLFLNLGRVQNLSLYILPGPSFSFKKNQTVSQGTDKLGNPITTYDPNHPRAVFLNDLKIGYNQWICSCNGIGWIEKWFRRWRTVYCGFGASPESLSQCRQMSRDLRSAKCSSSKKSVLNGLKFDLECDAFSCAFDLKISSRIALISSIVLTILFNI